MTTRELDTTLSPNRKAQPVREVVPTESDGGERLAKLNPAIQVDEGDDEGGHIGAV